MSNLHGAQLAQDLLSLINTNKLQSAGYFGEDLPEAVFQCGGKESVMFTVYTIESIYLFSITTK